MGIRTISVIVPTIGRLGDLQACLDSIRKSDYRGVQEILVVDDASPHHVRLEPGIAGPIEIKVIRNGVRLGAAQSRNLGASAANCEILAFLDDDARVSPNWFAVVQKELKDDCTAITGPVVGFDDSTVAQLRQERYDARYRGLQDGERVAFIAGGNCAIWRHKFVALGGFPPTKLMSDRLLATKLFRQGQGCHFVWSLRINHRNSKGLLIAVAEAFEAGKTSVLFEPKLDGNEPQDLNPSNSRPFLFRVLRGILSSTFVVGGLWFRHRLRQRKTGMVSVRAHEESN